MRYRPRSPKPRVSNLRKRQLRLRPGHLMARGAYAKRGFVAWNQPSDDESAYNTARPFFGAQIALRQTLYWDPRGDELYLPALKWIEMVEKQRDWREVEEEKLAELDAVCVRLKKLALWMQGIPEDQGSIRPVGEETPSERGATAFLVAWGQIQKCITVARRRIEETRTLASRRMQDRRSIAEEFDEAASEARVKAWQNQGQG